MCNSAEVVDKIRERIVTLKQTYNWTENSLADDSATQKRLNRQLSHGSTITLETLLLILKACPGVSTDWLLFGKGEMTEDNGAAPKDASDTTNRFMSLLEAKDSQIDQLLKLLSKN